MRDRHGRRRGSALAAVEIARRLTESIWSMLTRVGREPAALAVGAGAVWVVNSGDGTVSRIDPATNDVDQTIHVGSSPAGIVVAGGLVWVSAQEP